MTLDLTAVFIDGRHLPGRYRRHGRNPTNFSQIPSEKPPCLFSTRNTYAPGQPPSLGLTYGYRTATWTQPHLRVSTSRSIHPSRWSSSTREGSRLRVDVDVQDAFQSSRSKFILISFSGSPLVSVIRLRRVSDLRACLQTTSQPRSPMTPSGSHPPPTFPPHQPTGSSLARKPRYPHGRRPSSTESTFLFLTASHQKRHFQSWIHHLLRRSPCLLSRCPDNESRRSGSLFGGRHVAFRMLTNGGDFTDAV